MSVNGIKKIMLPSKVAEQAFSISLYIYDLLEDLPDDEKWDTARKLRSAANDALVFTAEAANNLGPQGAEYEWNNAHKSLSRLHALCRLIIKQKFAEIDSEIMVKLENLLSEVKLLHKQSALQTVKIEKESLDGWLKRYKIWKETEL